MPSISVLSSISMDAVGAFVNTSANCLSVATCLRFMNRNATAPQRLSTQSRAAKMPTTSREAHVAHNLTVFEPFLGRPLSASLAAVPAVIAGHRYTCGPFRAQLQRSTDSECITRDLPENFPCSYFVPNSINTVLPRYLYL